MTEPSEVTLDSDAECARPGAHPWAERIEAAAILLEAVVDDRSLLAGLPDELKRRLLIAAGRASRPDDRAKKKLSKAERRKKRHDRRQHDEQLLDETGIRKLRAAPIFPTPKLSAPDDTSPPAVPTEDLYLDGEELVEPRNCYVCKSDFRRLHFFYDSLCPPCAAFNWHKRNLGADLSGRVAIVTGGRVKIGYQAVVKLLRSGAKVIVTTRFPRDAANRFAAEEDASSWLDRLEVHGLDLRHTPSVESFAKYVNQTQPRLDLVINNACQTVRRPPAFYSHMMELEAEQVGRLSATAQEILRPFEEVRGPLSLAEGGTVAVARGRETEARIGWTKSADLSQVPLLLEDLESGAHLFPTGCLDADLQQVDLRKTNSWRMVLSEVSTVELLEVHLVNAVAPFVLNARLKPLMMRDRTDDKHVVNVSAMEGQFRRSFKTDKHPHTNMAKAALNMMTRTSAPEYARDGIFMNSVDTGWITDEDPVEHQRRKTEEHRFHPPLDIVDAAARICDPYIHGLLTGEHVWGRFLKDYRPVDW